MSDDFCPMKQMVVDIQENGIIRQADNGYLIGRLCDYISYEDLPIIVGKIEEIKKENR